MIIDNAVDLEILCTDERTLDWIASETEQVASKKRDRKFKVPSGELLGYRLSGLGYEQWKIGWWLIQQLGAQGWEPFAFETSVGEGYSSPLLSPNSRVIYQLRREAD